MSRASCLTLSILSACSARAAKTSTTQGNACITPKLCGLVVTAKRECKQVKQVEQLNHATGAEGGSRTRTSLRTTDFKSRDRPHYQILRNDISQYLRAWRSSRYRYGWLRINTSRHHLSPIFFSISTWSHNRSRHSCKRVLNANDRHFCVSHFSLPITIPITWAPSL